jgi:hypothetical protein
LLFLEFHHSTTSNENLTKSPIQTHPRPAAPIHKNQRTTKQKHSSLFFSKRKKTTAEKKNKTQSSTSILKSLRMPPSRIAHARFQHIVFRSVAAAKKVFQIQNSNPYHLQ